MKSVEQMFQGKLADVTKISQSAPTYPKKMKWLNSAFWQIACATAGDVSLGKAKTACLYLLNNVLKDATLPRFQAEIFLLMAETET